MSKIEWVRGTLHTWLLSLIRSRPALALSLLLPLVLLVGASYYIDSMVFRQNVSRLAMATCGVFAIAKAVAFCVDHIGHINAEGSINVTGSSSSSSLSRGDDLTAILRKWTRSPDGRFIHGSSSSRGMRRNSMLRDVALCRHCRRRPIVVPMDEEAAVLMNPAAAAAAAARYVVTSSNVQQHQAIRIPQFSAVGSAQSAAAPSPPDSAAAAAIHADDDDSFHSSVDDEEETVCKTTVFETHSSDNNNNNNNNNKNRSRGSDTIFSALHHEFYGSHDVDADHESAVHTFLEVGRRSAAAGGSSTLQESYEADEVTVDVKHQILPLISTPTDGRQGSSEQKKGMYRCSSGYITTSTCCCDATAAAGASAAEEEEGSRRNGGHEEEEDASSSNSSMRAINRTSSSSWSVLLDHHHQQQQQQLITDAELQKAAAEYYTLEGDVLWTRPPVPPPPPSDPQHHMADLYRPCSTFSINPCLISRLSSNTSSPKMQQQQQQSKLISSGKPAADSINSCNITIIDDAYDDGAEAQRQAGANHLRRLPPHHHHHVDEDILIDLKLRDIAFASRNKVGDESNYMSTAGSFRDMGSFRELLDHETWRSDHHQLWDAAAGFENMVGNNRIGCCDDHEKPCITHCRSRSKVLQTDPLISIASLSKEQEIMDVLWQEQDEHHHHMYDADCGVKRRFNCNSSSCSSNDGSTLGMGSNRSSSDAKPAPDPDHKLRESNHPQNRRRSFIGICRVLRELGLKQCLQSSRVNN